jgi:hypothetical protein
MKQGKERSRKEEETKRLNLALWSRVFLEKLMVASEIRKFPAFYEARRFTICSQEHATDPYLEPS